MTNSEQICNRLIEKCFLKEFVFSDLYVEVDGIRQELCDCLVSLNGISVVFQIKERNPEFKTDNESWLTKKIYKKATSQIKDTLSNWEIAERTTFKNQYGDSVTLERGTQIIPVILFDNPQIDNYIKVYHSKTSGAKINIFSLRDFETMLSVLMVPVDIIDYLYLRAEYIGDDYPSLFINDVSPEKTLIGKITSEKSLAEFFQLSHNVENIDKLAIEAFMHIFEVFRDRQANFQPQYFDLIANLLSFDCQQIEAFMTRFGLSWQRALNGESYLGNLMVYEHRNKRKGVLFISNSEQYENSKNDLVLLDMFKYHFRLEEAMCASFYKLGSDEVNDVFINWALLKGDWIYDKGCEDILKKCGYWQQYKI